MPGALTAWHSHARGEYLYIPAGIARFGTRDGGILDVHPGQTLHTPSNEHWHAGATGVFMEHLAILESADDPSTPTTQAEHITEDDYDGHRSIELVPRTPRPAARALAARVGNAENRAITPPFGAGLQVDVRTTLSNTGLCTRMSNHGSDIAPDFPLPARPTTSAQLRLTPEARPSAERYR